MKKIKYSIIIPCFNEENNLELLLKSLTKINNNKSLEIIIVDNGSTDNSKEVLIDLIGKIQINNLKIVSIKKNIGYGHGIMSGLKASSGDFLGWTHADLQTDVADVLKGFDLIKKSSKNIIVKGKRLKRGILDNIFTFLMGAVCTIILKTAFYDINAQPKIFSRAFYEKVKDKAPNDFSLDLYLLYTAKKLQYDIIDFPVIFKERLYGEAKGGGSFKTKLKLSIRTFAYILDIKKNDN